MPAEWEPHDAIWLAWPYDLDSFPKINKVEKTYTEIISAIHETERVELLVLDEAMKTKASEMLSQAGVNFSRINFHVYDYADVWMRDTAPTFLVKSTPSSTFAKASADRSSPPSHGGEKGQEASPPVSQIGGEREGVLAAVKWKFNSWGNKWPTLLKDDNTGYFVAKALKTQYFKPGIVMEGGAFDVNGSGSLLTTEQCLLNPNRNPNLTKSEIENYLKEYLGVSNIIWLKAGIAGDDTDGHIDDTARFVNSAAILAAYEDDESDENYSILKANYDILRAAKDEQGRALSIIKLPMPKLTRPDGSRLPASYANFYIGNGKVLVPTFNQENDSKALEIIKQQFPGRGVVGIDCSDMVYGFGTIHCASQQQPAV